MTIKSGNSAKGKNEMGKRQREHPGVSLMKVDQEGGSDVARVGGRTIRRE